MTSDLQEQLIELQTRVAHQEDTLDKLNDVIGKQDGEIMQLQHQMRLLAKRLDDMAFNQGDNNIDANNERPPHY